MTVPGELIIVSLERWDEVWRRNQLLVDALIRELPDLRVLFVEPPLPALRNFNGARPPRTKTRMVAGLPGVTALRAVQWMPDRLTSYLPVRSLHTVSSEARRLGLTRPVLWINDHSFARAALHTGWPVVYDITDDWLLAEISPAKRRQARLDDERLLRGADAVVVCSPALAASRGLLRQVELIPNGVDLSHFRTPQPRPEDLGGGPVAVYVGTLHEDRLDVPLCCCIADELPEVHFVYVGPDSLRSSSHDALAKRPNITLLGPRAYSAVPAYMQHADAIFIPHVVSPFTESLDPIKARECVAVGTPTISTPVAGFRDLGPPIRVCPSETFAAGLRATLQDHRDERVQGVWTWADAARKFLAVLDQIAK